jgi:hypothetical protein
MVLEIKFTEKDKSIVHLVVDDGCKVDLNNSKSVTDIKIRDGSIKLHCPTCGKDYEITPKEYHSAFKIFKESQKN